MKKILKKTIKKIKKIILWYKKVLTAHSDYKVSFYTKIKFALKGFTVNEYIWYNLKHNNYNDYISDYKRIESRNINCDYKFILDDKLIFEEIFRNYIRVPYNYGYISAGHIYSLHNCNLNNDNVIDFIKEKKALVLKILKGYEGNVYKIDAKKVSMETLGKYFPNTPMLAAVVKVSGIMSDEDFLNDMIGSFKHKFAKKPEVIDGNMKALEMALQEVTKL